jgi:DNA-binding beta-propeller fold protein YncE
MLDAETLVPDRAVSLCSDPWPPAFSRDGDRAYVVCRPGLVIEVDPALALVLRRAVVAADSGRSCEAGPAALSSNETLLLVPCRASGRLLYLDRATLEPWDSMAVAPGISRVAPAGGGIAVVLVPDSDRALILDLRGKRRLAGVPTAPAPVEVALDAAGRRAFVLAAGRSSAAGGVLAIELPSGAVRARVDLPPGARTLAIWPGARKVRMRWTTASASGGRVAR